MTQFNPNPAGDTYAAEQPPQPLKTSVLAIISLVLGLLFCIPFAAPLVGLVLGIVALVMIAKPERALKGRGLAIAGVVVSAIVLLGHVVTTILLVMSVNLLVQPMESFVLAVENSDFDSARTYLSAETADLVTDEELAKLRDLLADEHGTVGSVSLDFSGRVYTMGVPPPATPWNQSQAFQGNWASGGGGAAGPIPIVCEFSNGTAFGLLIAAGDPNSQQVSTALLVDSFTLIGDDGPWSFPFAVDDDE